MTPKDALNALLQPRDLAREEMLAVMRAIMGGEMTPAQIAGILIALRAKGESVTELAAAAQVMRELSIKVDVADLPHLVDTCGTGGDGAHTFNISTAATFVAAAAGCHVAKHGGRSVSSTTGSADVLEALGVNLNLKPEQVGACIREVGVGFMFAPNYHAAMKHAAPVRRDLGVRTLFNLLGPLTNPAGAPNQVMGVFSRALTGKLAEVLKHLGSRHVMVVHAADGLDELSLGAPTHVAEVIHGQVREYTVSAKDLGLAETRSEVFSVQGAEEAKARLLAALTGADAAARDIVALNAGAAIYVAGCAVTLDAGVRAAQEAIASGAARARLDALVAASQGMVA